MILFFSAQPGNIYAVQTVSSLSQADLSKLDWLFAGAKLMESGEVAGKYVGARAVMITPWSTNAVEITQNMGISSIKRIEQYWPADQPGIAFDPMLMQRYNGLGQELFTIHITPEPVKNITNIDGYNQSEGLALSEEEVAYLEDVSERIGRPLTDSEVFGFSQVNSEHCRHKIFNGIFVIDGEEQPGSLFKMIKKTSQKYPNSIVSAYKDNVAFVKGPVVQHFAPQRPDQPAYYQHQSFESVLSLKAETHNFPTTVEPFNGAATGSGGEIRDRLAGGKGALPLAGTAVYMTSYSRLKDGERTWEAAMPERPWLYQTPIDILIKASNGASDFGNKFGQPLIAGSLLTFEHQEHGRKLGFDKVIMMAGGVGFGKATQAQKDVPKKGDKVVVLGGDNYRIGMGGAAVSSADTGEFSSGIELNAVQRSNPEMQKRVANTIRAMVEMDYNRIVSIHDHGAGGHLNCLSELLEETGGVIELKALPVGDPTLSAKEIIGNESQERMGLIIAPEDLPQLEAVAKRERAPLYVVGEVTQDFRFVFAAENGQQNPIDLELTDFFGSSPTTIMNDEAIDRRFEEVDYEERHIQEYISSVLKLEAVACKDWLTNKVDRCVGGLVAKQQCAGPLQLPLNDYGIMSLDYGSENGIATSIGHAPVSGLIDAGAGVRNSIAEALTNLVWAPLQEGLTSVSLSANWMWPCRNEGEDARLYEAVRAASDFAIDLGINIPTGKDSLSMKQKYDGDEVLAPGTVIISAAGHCHVKSKAVEPVFQKGAGEIYYLNLSKDAHALGGSSFAQIRNKIGAKTPDIKEPAYFRKAFDAIQNLINEGLIVAGHDVSAGGLLTCLLEMCFADNDLGAAIDLETIGEKDSIKVLFAENSAVVLQSNGEDLARRLANEGIDCFRIGSVTSKAVLEVKNGNFAQSFDITQLRDDWYETSFLLDQKQSGVEKATERYQNYKKQPLQYRFPDQFTGQLPNYSGPRPKAAVIREQGSNSEREMANALYLAGFDVKDVHMTDLISGKETLEDIQFIGAVGGFANSDVLGSAKGWAGAFLFNEKAKKALDDFFARPDTLSIGICNGCQLFLELELITPDHTVKPKMHHNDTHKHESAFTSVKIQENHSVMLSSLAGATLGVWISHGEGKFHLPMEESAYHIVGKYGYAGYPSNPNGSDYNTAMLCSADGRHLVTMPHIERSTFQWNWAHYPKDRNDQVSPWLEAFVNARNWILKHQ